MLLNTVRPILGLLRTRNTVAAVSCSFTRQLSIGVLGAKFDKGQTRVGASLGPEAIRTTGVLKDLGHLGHKVTDLGDVQCSNEEEVKLADQRLAHLRNATSVGRFNQQLSEQVSAAIAKHDVVVTLGGDHSIAIGTIHGHGQTLRKQDQLAVLWVDAHADINTPLTSSSGNFHGKPNSFLVHGMEPYMVQLPELAWCRPCVLPHRLVYIGLRDVEPLERVIIEKMGIRAYAMREIDRHGMSRVVEMAMDQLTRSAGADVSLHVSFDIDALDPAEAPCTGTPVRGGLRLRECQEIMEEVHRSRLLRAMDVVEVNPQLHGHQEALLTADAARHVLLATFGRHRGGNATDDFQLPRP